MSNYKSYFYKSLGLREDSLPGGKGDEAKKTQVNPEQLQMGIKVEMEHTHDPDLSREIAMDHLSEDPHYYSHLKDAGLADELPEGIHGEMKPKIPMMQKLFSPTAIMPTPVIAVGVRGTRTGLLPAGGIVDDPEKARLGGLELVKNLKPNSQGAIANTPASDTIKADGGHFTPDNKEITKGTAPVTNVKGEDTIHPMQVQQLGNEPFKDDGTTRDGEHTPSAAGGDEKSCPTIDKEKETPEPEDDEPKKGPWGIDMDDEPEEEEGEVNIDIKETLREAQKQICRHCKKPQPCPCDKYDKENQEESDPESPKFNWKRFGGAGAKPADYKEGVMAPTNDSGVAGWDDLVELTNGASFDTQLGKIDMWALMGFEKLTMRDAEQQTQKFFDFIVRHKDETIRYYAARGENLQFADNTTLRQEWLQSKKKDVEFGKQLKNQPKPCKVCGQTFTPTKGEGICPKCVTKTSEPSPSECSMRERFQKLANIPQQNEAGALSELEELVGRLNKKGNVSPVLAKAQKYLEERKKKH